ncbi:dTDP-4-dehydrorhamnose reductase [Acetoanaerobium pronyense]|uniref:dTDP-4-dehydrorhamnose reductase n=1 Tax=Acetoanaerobium pronyense TaxID=1482736 RepID=A0ABS4KJ17_9FIRM|nr:dTDP-4-dehydrorhamnose reductase [Acetoanaerobium pronyense]MBP2027136.1 dTDP-4-dehydrorhamnose reductase [Acetoanaerobium pronyense]
MNILVVGGNGMLGKEIVEILLKLGYDVLYPSSNDLNLLDRGKIKKYFSENRMDYIIHCAGFTNVNEAENNFDAYKINCESMHWIVHECQVRDIPLLYFSTDYVFDGDKVTPYIEEDIKNPLNTYGMTKSISEDIIISNLSNYRILRVSWLFGDSSKCFPMKIIEKLKEGKEFSVVYDQVGSPTYVKDIATKINELINIPSGIYHLTNSGHTSWYEYSIFIAELLNFSKDIISKTNSKEFKTPLTRPLNSRLSNEKVKSYNISLRNYKEATKEFIKINYN